jgi:hypothetical protein
MESLHNPYFKDEPYKYHIKLLEILGNTLIGKEGNYKLE